MSIRWHNSMNAAAVIPDWAFVMVVLAVAVLLVLSCPWPVPPTWEQELAKMERGWKMILAMVALLALGWLMLWWNSVALSRGGTSGMRPRTQQSQLQWPPMTANRRNAPAAALLTPPALRGRARQRVYRQARRDRRAYEATRPPTTSCETAAASPCSNARSECPWA